jgi:hypothetical protein
MSIAVGLTLTAALLAAGAGIAKLASPRTAVEAMQSVRLPASDSLVRVAALAEIALGALVLASGALLPRLGLALTYLGFAVFSIVAMRAGRATPCGCFGRSGSVIGWRHVVTDLVLAAGLVTAAAGHGRSAARLARLSPSLGVGAIAVALVAALLAAAFLSGPMTHARPETIDA